MGITDEKAVTRTKKEGFDANTHSGRGGNAGSESESYGDKQKRDDRANSSQPSILSTGEADAGGMYRQLISVYREQVAIKESEIERINNEAQRVQNEKLGLEARIQEFELFLKELEQELQEVH